MFSTLNDEVPTPLAPWALTPPLSPTYCDNDTYAAFLIFDPLATFIFGSMDIFSPMV